MRQLGKVMVDADVCINLARYQKINALRLVLGNIAQEVYMHEYIIHTELLSSGCASEISRMVEEKIIRPLSPDKDLSDADLQNYHATCLLLSDAMGVILSEGRCKHKGEVVSVAMAKTLGIHIFMSNERALQREIDECINIGIDDIRVYRMYDIILWIKENPECGLSRKDAKIIWIGSFDKIKMEHYKNEFDHSLWPL
ncbi:MAG: hypothetical protein GX099_08390 [Clostridiaceae bacterium]|jgi:hypothetical protein|nr:hypothetical protein [Oscillospiraceae bacterium]NLO63424.1 hypothetical protein [Clostridiaceae bacterium]